MIQEKAKNLDEQVLGTFIKSYSKRYEQWKKGNLLFCSASNIAQASKEGERAQELDKAEH